MNPHVWWYLARASGLVAYGLLAVSTIWGLAVSTRLLGRWPAPGWTLDLHRFLGGMALTFSGIHLAGLLLDGYVRFDLVDLLVPLAARWRPAAVAWGIVALYLLLAVELTSLARRHLPHRLWRRLHLGAFPLLVAATVHLVTAGSDHATLAVVALLVAVVAAMTFLLLFRLLYPPQRRPPRKPSRDVTLTGEPRSRVRGGPTQGSPCGAMAGRSHSDARVGGMVWSTTAHHQAGVAAEELAESQDQQVPAVRQRTSKEARRRVAAAAARSGSVACQ